MAMATQHSHRIDRPPPDSYTSTITTRPTQQPSPALMRYATRRVGESEAAFMSRIQKMTDEVQSYCDSTSFVKDYRRPEGGWACPGEEDGPR